MERLFATYKSDNKETKETCCERPFTTCSIKTGITTCRSCNKKFKDLHAIIYDCKSCDLKEIETDVVLNLLKDNYTNWTLCKKCNKHVQYTRKQKIEYINT